MTVNEYRKKHPDCQYCDQRIPPFSDCICVATNKRMSKRRAKKCPCYVPQEWRYEKKGGAEDVRKEVEALT